MESDLDKMRMGAAYRFQIQMRNWVGTFRPLTVLEMTEVGREVAKKLLDEPNLRNVPVIESALFSIKTLARASSEKPGAPYAVHEAVLQDLTPDELMFLWQSYNAEVDRINPMIEKVDDVRIRELMAEAKKNPGRLTDLSLRQVVAVCRMALAALPEGS